MNNLYFRVKKENEEEKKLNTATEEAKPEESSLVCSYHRRRINHLTKFHIFILDHDHKRLRHYQLLFLLPQM